jgi:hypothetical protein
MITGSRRGVPLLIGLLAGLAGAPVFAADWGVEQLMQALGQVKSSRAQFVERKHLAILTAPLESSGTLV